MLYPTKEEILADLYFPTEQEIALIQGWQKEHWIGWKNKSAESKHNALCDLYDQFMELYPDKTFIYRPSNQWMHVTTQHTGTYILMDVARPSVVSALHELGHQYHGSSELQACRFSVGIFKLLFPRSYNKLVWDGHMLVVA